MPGGGRAAGGAWAVGGAGRRTLPAGVAGEDTARGEDEVGGNGGRGHGRSREPDGVLDGGGETHDGGGREVRLGRRGAVRCTGRRGSVRRERCRGTGR